jgi:1A family penicillin-binding protein
MGKHSIRSRRAEPAKTTRTRLGLFLLRSGVIAFFFGAVALFTLVQATPLPQAPDYVASTVYGRNNEVIARLYLEDRTPIPIGQLPGYLLDAVVAIEDYRFFDHSGVDPIGIARAFYRNAIARRRVEGASTITQQLARELYLTQERTYTRKAQEAVLALKLEQVYDKRRILEMYLNQVYFGHGAFGVEVASQIYFGKSASEVTLGQAALLAGVLRSPENYSPYRNAGVALRRRSFVLTRMVELGYIDAATAESARNEELQLATLRPRVPEAPYFIDYILAEIGLTHPEVARAVYQAGFEIYTTLDLEMQRAANDAMRTQLTRGSPDAKGVTQPQAALVAVDPQTGGILAMVGGRSYRETQLNRAAQAHRQPGSAFKPFMYAALIDRHYTTISQQMCEPTSFPAGPGQPNYTPVDYGAEPYHNRPLTMREAIKVSDNVAAVKWLNEVGPQAMIDYARRMGIYSPLAPYLPLVLGTFEVYPVELATAYCPLANGGMRVSTLAVRRVVARDGDVLIENQPSMQPAIPPATAFLVTDMLRSVMGPGGTGAHLGWQLNRPSAGKTGTTNDSKDAWFVGYVPQVVCAVYVGYDEPAALWGPGGRVAGPIWLEFMRAALRDVPPADFPRPPDVVEATVCTQTLQLANPTCPTVVERFRLGTQPAAVCPIWHFAQPPANGDPGGLPELPEGQDDVYDELELDEEDREALAAWRRWLEETWERWVRDGGELPEGP